MEERNGESRMGGWRTDQTEVPLVVSSVVRALVVDVDMAGSCCV